MPKLREKVINEPILDLAALKAINDSVANNGIIVNVISLGLYKLDKLSITAADDNYFVVTNSGNGRWVKMADSLLGSAVYTNASPTLNASGGIPAGSTFFSTPKTFAEYVAAVNYTAAYTYPAFTSFAITGIPLALEVGQKITGIQTLTWGISAGLNVQPMSLTITDTTGSFYLKHDISITSPTTYDFSLYSDGGLEYDVPASHSWRIDAHNTLNGEFSRPLTINWQRKYYGGSYADATFASNADILALSSSALSATYPSQVTMTTGNSYFHLVIPTSWTQPAPTAFKNHATGFGIGTMTVTPITVTNDQSIPVTCNDYCSPQKLTNPITVDIS